MNLEDSYAASNIHITVLVRKGCLGCGLDLQEYGLLVYDVPRQL